MVGRSSRPQHNVCARVCVRTGAHWPAPVQRRCPVHWWGSLSSTCRAFSLVHQLLVCGSAGSQLARPGVPGASGVSMYGLGRPNPYKDFLRSGCASAAHGGRTCMEARALVGVCVCVCACARARVPEGHMGRFNLPGRLIGARCAWLEGFRLPLGLGVRPRVVGVWSNPWPRGRAQSAPPRLSTRCCATSREAAVPPLAAS